MLKRVKKRYDLNIAVADTTVSETFELDKNICAIYGLQMVSNRDDLMYYRGSQRIELNREEIFPEKYESKLLMSGIGVAPDDRFYSLGKLEPGNHKLKVDYRDEPHTSTLFNPYRVSIYLDCEITDVV